MIDYAELSSLLKDQYGMILSEEEVKRVGDSLIRVYECLVEME